MAGVLSYSLSLSTSAFTGPLGAASSAMRGFASHTASAAATLTKIAAPLAALGGGFSFFKTLEKAANMESLQKSFQTVMGSAEAAGALLEKVRRLEPATNFGFEDLAKSARSLLAVTDRDKLIPTLTMIGDVAAAAVKPVTDLATMYAKIKGGGKVQSEDLNQLSDFLPGSLVVMADVLQTNVEGLREMAEAGRITGAALEATFLKLTSKGGMAFEGMQTQAKTTNGLMSTLNSAVSALMVSIGTPINDFLKPIIAANIDRLQTLNIQVKAFLDLWTSAKDQGQLGAFIGVTLKLAMIDAINLFHGGFVGAVAYLGEALPGIANIFRTSLMMKDILGIFKNTFMGVADYLGARILQSVIELKLAMGLIPDLDPWKRARASSKNHLNTAKNLTEDFNMKDGLPEALAAWKEVDKKSKAASAKAMEKPFIDPTQAQKERDDFYKETNPDAAKRFTNPEPAKPDPADSKPVTPQGKLIRDAKTPAKSGADTAAKDAELAARQAEAASTFALEGKLLDAKIKGRHKLIQTVEHEIKLQQTKLSLMQQQGLSEEAATAAAKARVAQEEKAANPRKAGTNHKDTAESNKARSDRRSSADKVKDINSGREPGSNSDRLGALAKAKRDAAKADRKEKADLKRDPEKLARANKAAEEIKKAAEQARDRAEAQERYEKRLLEGVEGIDRTFKNVALA